jgi:hypothetical protein
MFYKKTISLYSQEVFVPHPDKVNFVFLTPIALSMKDLSWLFAFAYCHLSDTRPLYMLDGEGKGKIEQKIQSICKDSESFEDFLTQNLPYAVTLVQRNFSDCNTCFDWEDFLDSYFNKETLQGTGLSGMMVLNYAEEYFTKYATNFVCEDQDA